MALAGATAAATAALAIFALGSDQGPGAGQRVGFASLPPGMKIDADLEPRAYGTEIEMYVEGVPSGTLCRVILRDPRGAGLPAGSFRYREGAEEAVLSSALDISRIRAVVIHVGRRAFAARVASAGGA
jgi:hypothetical protein